VKYSRLVTAAAVQNLARLGWTPEANPEGSYLLQVIADEDWSTPIVVYKSKNKSEVVGKIDDLLLKIASGDIEV
jgi:hypothetical protein